MKLVKTKKYKSVGERMPAHLFLPHSMFQTKILDHKPSNFSSFLFFSSPMLPSLSQLYVNYTY